MPKEYPAYSTVYYYFSKWRTDGSWNRIHDRLVEWVRVDRDRDSSPSVASVDSHRLGSPETKTVPTAVMVSDSVDYVMDVCHWIVDVVLRPNGSKGFVLLPKRWTVERTYG